MNGNHMGPRNEGPKTGRGMGFCGKNAGPGYEGAGRRNGRGHGHCGQGQGLGHGRGRNRGTGRSHNRGRIIDGDTR